MNPPLTEEEVSAIEQQWQISLPTDYREFLLQVGNGGMGSSPIHKFGEIDGGLSGERAWELGKNIFGDFNKPFPYTEKFNVEESFWGEVEGEEDEDEPNERLQITYYKLTTTHGSIPICHNGCCLRSFLVVKGDERGHMWG